MSQRFHITFARPVRVRLGADMRSTMVIAVDAAYEWEADTPTDRYVLTTDAIFTAGERGASPPKTPMRTTIHVHRDTISSWWPLPDKN